MTHDPHDNSPSPRHTGEGRQPFTQLGLDYRGERALGHPRASPVTCRGARSRATPAAPRATASPRAVPLACARAVGGCQPTHCGAACRCAPSRRTTHLTATRNRTNLVTQAAAADARAQPNPRHHNSPTHHHQCETNSAPRRVPLPPVSASVPHGLHRTLPDHRARPPTTTAADQQHHHPNHQTHNTSPNSQTRGCVPSNCAPLSPNARAHVPPGGHQLHVARRLPRPRVSTQGATRARVDPVHHHQATRQARHREQKCHKSYVRPAAGSGWAAHRPAGARCVGREVRGPAVRPNGGGPHHCLAPPACLAAAAYTAATHSPPGRTTTPPNHHHAHAGVSCEHTSAAARSPLLRLAC